MKDPEIKDPVAEESASEEAVAENLVTAEEPVAAEKSVVTKDPAVAQDPVLETSVIETPATKDPEVIEPEPVVQRPPAKDPVDVEMARLTRRSLLTGGIATLAGAGLWAWVANSPKEDNIPSVLRRGHQFNEKLSRGFFNGKRLAPEFPLERAVKKVRVNEDIGMSEDVDRATWKIRLEGAQGHHQPVDIALKEIKGLPHAEHVTELKCVEGWSQIVHWGGARFADLAKVYPPPAGTQYVAMETPDGEYYVGLDLESALQPQTLLVYEMSGEPVTEEHGAPLRLCIPTKYGIKNIKQIGSIRYTNERPKDYWAERGYDWYAGL